MGYLNEMLCNHEKLNAGEQGKVFILYSEPVKYAEYKMTMFKNV